MLHGVQASSAFHQLRREGITFLYRGIFPPLAQKTVSLALMFGKWFLSSLWEPITQSAHAVYNTTDRKMNSLKFTYFPGVYDGTRRPLVDIGFNPYVAKIIAGVAAGSVEAALMPFERVQTLLADSTYHSLFKNTAQSFRYVWTNHGFTELYRGLVPILLRNGPSNAMFFVLREEAATRLPRHVSYNFAKSSLQPRGKLTKFFWFQFP